MSKIGQEGATPSEDSAGATPREEGSALAARTSRPLVSPDMYSGVQSWSDWVEHFEATASVNGWSEATKLLWLPVRLSGKAQTAWKRLTPDAKSSYAAAKEALQKRFEPESKRKLYLVEFQTRRRRPTEQWNDFGDELRVLADKAFPELDDKAKELLSLERYLGELDNPQIAFTVRQKQPKTLDEAVMCTLETEIYLRDSRGAKSAVSAVEVPVAATRTIPAEQESLVKMMQSLLERLGRLEASEGRGGRTRNRSGRDRDSKEPVICYKCGKEGHFARGCASGEQRRQTGKLDTLDAKDQACEGKQVVQLERDLYSMAVNPTLSHYVTAIVRDLLIQLMLDTGAAVSLVRKDVWDRLGGAGIFGLEPWTGRHLVGVEGSTVPVHDATTLEIQLHHKVVRVDFVVVHSLRVESILGLDLLEEHNCVIDLPQKVLYVAGTAVQLQQYAEGRKECIADGCNEVSVSLTETISIPAYSEVCTLAHFSAACNGVWLVEGYRPALREKVHLPRIY